MNVTLSRSFLGACALAWGLFTAGLSPAAAQTTDVQAQIDALTARIAKLEGGTTLTDADIVGSYALFGFQNEMNLYEVDTQVRSYVYRGKITFKSDGKFVLSNTESGSQLDHLSGGSSTINYFSNASTNRGAWKVVGNQLVSSQLIHMNIVAGGQMMVGTASNGTDHTNVLLVLTRLP